MPAMLDNIENIQHYILNHVANYEDEKAGRVDLHERMLRSLEAPYERLMNHDRILELLRQKLSEKDVQVWFEFPDFDYRTEPVLVEELANRSQAAGAEEFQRSAQKLIDEGFLAQAPRKDGRLGYMRTYLLYLVFGAVLGDTHDAFTEALTDWWMHLLHESAHLRTVHAEHRVLPHEASLPGKARVDMNGVTGGGTEGHWRGGTGTEGTGQAGGMGKISMSLEIPDMREVLPTDMADSVLSGVDTIAVVDCICRAATESRGERKCDYPVEGVCFLFNEAANEAIKVGYGKQISHAEGLRLMHELRDMGLVQVISNALRPLSMCNCCSCCCICLSSMQRKESCLAIPSRFVAVISAPDQCVGCGRCAASCQMSAIKAGDSGIEILPSECIGCGQCAVHCPAGVITMNVKPGQPGGPQIPALNRIYL